MKAPDGQSNRKIRKCHRSKGDTFLFLLLIDKNFCMTSILKINSDILKWKNIFCFHEGVLQCVFLVCL